jgi:lipoprotein NlpI
MKKIAFAALLLAGTTAPCFGAGYDDLNAGISYFEQGQYDNAIIWLDKALADGDMIPDHRRIAHVDKGLAHSAKGDMGQAIADFTAAITANPDHVLAYRLRSSAYLASNDAEKALADLDKLRLMRPSDNAVAINDGWLHWQLGHVQQSAEAFRTGAEFSAFSWAWLQLANVKLQKPIGDYKEGVESRKWPGQIPRFFLGHLSEAELLKAAEDTKSPNAVCDAYLLAGMWRIVHNDRPGGAPLLQSAKEKCKENSPNGRIARSELEKIATEEKAK